MFDRDNTHRLHVTADLHLTNKHSRFQYDEDGVSDLLKAQHQFCKSFAQSHTGDSDVYREHRLFLGDWADYTNLSPILQRMSNECFYEVVDIYGGHHGENIFVGGNHTISSAQPKYSVMGAMNHIVSQFVDNDYNLDIVYGKEPSGKPRTIPNDRLMFHCFPYQRDFDKLARRIDEHNSNMFDSDYGFYDYEDYYNIMLFHFPIVGGRLDNGRKAENGVPLKPEHVSNFNLCLGGDFHTRHQVFDDVWYVGAPFSLQKGDADSGRKSHCQIEIDVEHEKYQVKLIDNPFDYPMQSFDSWERCWSCFQSVDDRWTERWIVDLEVDDRQDIPNEHFDEMREHVYSMNLSERDDQNAIIDESSNDDEIDLDDIQDKEMIREVGSDDIRAFLEEYGDKEQLVKFFDDSIMPYLS